MQGGERISAGGTCLDLARKGALAAFLGQVDQEWIENCGKKARERAVGVFSTDAVIGEYINYYERVCSA